MTVSTSVVCGECGHEPGDPRTYCGECGAQEPWVEQADADFERDVELPVVFAKSISRDYEGLWGAFAQEVFGTRFERSDVENIPGELPDMDELHLTLYFKLTGDLEIKGPYCSQAAALKA